MTIIDQIETILELAHPQQKIWQAITTPEGLNQWFGNRVTMKLEAGSPILFEWDEYGEAGGIIEVVEPISRFAYRWRAHGIAEDVAMNKTNSTLVTFELTPTSTGTRLRVVENGFANLNPALRELSFRENSKGWDSELGELVAFLAGQPV
ncbi:MAG: activator of HSP90 ATPase [Ardenticatenaceae bacterium]|nr:MAG: activator of HSP90 ATPase [Ardenticatenaceae bacterium]